MYNKLLSLAGDLVFEKRQLSSGLRKLEGMLFSGAFAVEVAESLHTQVDHLSQRLDRLGALVESIARFVNQERLLNMSTVVSGSETQIHQLAKSYKKPVQLKVQGTEAYVEESVLQAFAPALASVLESTFEFGIEPEAERLARNKKKECQIYLDLKPIDEGYRLTLLYDGNGIQPPLRPGIDLQMARTGVKFGFEGKPGYRSAWFFYVPSNFGAYRCVCAEFGKNKVYIPHFYLSSFDFQSTAKAWSLGDSYSRYPVDVLKSDKKENFLKINTGLSSAIYKFDKVSAEPVECFIKPLSDSLNVSGRFLGVVASDNQDLILVLNPVYLVYGEEK